LTVVFSTGLHSHDPTSLECAEENDLQGVVVNAGWHLQRKATHHHHHLLLSSTCCPIGSLDFSHPLSSLFVV